MPSDRTPAEWAKFCAEKVMGWWRSCPANDWRDQQGHIAASIGWSPYENRDDAREVLSRLQALRQTEDGNMPDIWIRQWWDDSGEHYGVQIGDDYKADATGPHEGPAVCLLTEKIIGEKHAQDK